MAEVPLSSTSQHDLVAGSGDRSDPSKDTNAKIDSRTTAASPRDRIVAYLNEHGGQVESPDGLGLTTSMAAGTGYSQVAALKAMLVRLERDGVITRDVKGKRTYAVSLPKRRGAAKPAASPVPQNTPSGAISSWSGTSSGNKICPARRG